MARRDIPEVPADQSAVQQSWAERNAARREHHVKPPYREPGTFPAHSFLYETLRFLGREGVEYHMADANGAGAPLAASALLVALGVTPPGRAQRGGGRAAAGPSSPRSRSPMARGPGR